MSIQHRSAAAYLAVILRLLPLGSAWPRTPASVLYKVCGATSEEYARIDYRMTRLVEEADPRTALELLSEWETTYGLPDPCAGQADSIAERRDRLVAKVTMVGGQSAPYFVRLAERLGYTITVSECKARQHGDPHGRPFGGWAWNFVWNVNAPLITYRHRRHGQGYHGEPYATWGNKVLECVIRRLAPKHTHVRFIYE